MSPIERRRLRVPRGDRQALIRPEPAALPALVRRNQDLLASYRFALAPGSPRRVACGDAPGFREFRAAARAEVMAMARRYARRWGFAVQRDWSEPQPIILSGHQPRPFHPGVWLKNFLGGELASAVGGVALNLTVDSDEARGQAYRFPVRGGKSQGHEWQAAGLLVDGADWPGRDVPPGEAAVIEVPFAHAAPGIAFEEQPVAPPGSDGGANAGPVHPTGEAVGLPVGPATKDLATLKSYPMRWIDKNRLDRVFKVVQEQGSRTIQMFLSLPSDQMAEAFNRFWANLVTSLYHADSLGEAFAVARRYLEQELGLRNLELPVSALSDTSAFRLFVAAMLRRREDFFAAYNDSLHEFRRVYRERSPAQPVPDLASDGPRMELPYWVWRAGEPRRRLWVEPTPGGGLALAAEDEPVGRLSAEDLDDASRGAERLADLRRSGWKIRPRAISMTLFVRLAVGDVFIHGVGGALYDQITDAIIERLFGVRPPEIILASATVHLPLETFPATPADLSAAQRAVRDWRCNPDRLLPVGVRRGGEAKALIEEKKRLIAARGATRDERRRVWQRVREINGRLLALAPEQPDAAREELHRIQRYARYNDILTNREYPFCLYPAEDLAEFYRGAVRIG